MNKYSRMIKVLQSEIDWCNSNRDDSYPFGYQDGFVSGLKQAILLINHLEVFDELGRYHKGIREGENENNYGNDPSRSATSFGKKKEGATSDAPSPSRAASSSG